MKLFLMIAVIFYFLPVFSQVKIKRLPAWQTKQEKKLLKIQPLKNTASKPPTGTIYVPAEFAKMRGVLIQPTSYWSDTMDEYYGKMIKAIIEAKATPYLLAVDSFEYQGQTYKERDYIKEKILKPQGIDESKVVFLNNKEGNPIEYDAFWTRDYGPWYIYENGNTAIIDMLYYDDRTKDNAVNSQLAEIWNEPIYHTSLHTEGGNFMTDGLGTCWASTGVVNFNKSEYKMTEQEIDDVYKNYLGCKTISHPVSLPNEGTTHVDMYSKIINQDTILVGSSTKDLGATQNEIDALDNAANFYKNTQKPDGGNFNIIRIPMSFETQSDKDGTFRVYYTYTNSLIINNVVIIPQYDKPEDSIALKIYKKAMPEHKIIGIPAKDVIPWGGAVHCTTMQIPVKKYSSCGDGVVQNDEECEFNYFKGKTCKDFKFSGGTLQCINCKFDTSKCSNETNDEDMVSDEDSVADENTSSDNDSVVDENTSSDNDSVVDEITTSDKDSSVDELTAPDNDSSIDEIVTSDKDITSNKSSDSGCSCSTILL